MGKKRKWPRGRPPEEALRKIAEATLARGEPLLRTTTMTHTVGSSFYTAYAVGPENMEKLAEMIRNLGPEYAGVVYQKIEKNYAKHNRPFSGEEEDLISRAINEYIGHFEGKELISKASELAKQRLKQNNYIRDPLVIRRKVERTLTGEPEEFRTRMPKFFLHPNGKNHSEPQIGTQPRNYDEKTDSEKISKHIEDTITRLEKEEKNGGLEKICGRKADRTERRQEISKYLPAGHQKLIAYLMDKENYVPLLGVAELVVVDFNKDNTAPWLYQPFDETVKSLEELSEEELVGFVDGWARCDMVYKKPNGVYTILEVKQNAIDKTPPKSLPYRRICKNKEGKIIREDIKVIEKVIKDGKEKLVIEGTEPGKKQFVCNNNGTLALEQIGGYTGSKTEHIRKKDFENKNNSQYAPLKNPIEGYLAAYQIQEDIYDYLNSKEARSAFAICKEKVNNYVDSKILGYGAPKTVSEETDKTESEKMDKTKNLTSLDASFEYHSAFAKGTLDTRQGLLEVYCHDHGAHLYTLEGINSGMNIIQECISRGTLAEGQIDTEEYRKHGIMPVNISKYVIQRLESTYKTNFNATNNKKENRKKFKR